MRNYKVDNLYVGSLGNVRWTGTNKFGITSINRYIIFIKSAYSKSWSVEHCDYDKIGKDIFTGKEYFFWDGNYNTSKTIENAIGGCAIYESYPIENYLKFSQNKVSESELLDILEKLNNPRKEEAKEDEVATPITDSILTTILETSDLVKVSEISEEAKEEFLKELEQLAENYVQDINSLDSHNPFTSEYQIRMNYIKLLVDIEERIADPNKIKAYNLTKQLQTFKKGLNQEG